MRSGRVIACTAVVVGALVFACSSFEASPEPARADAGGDEDTSPPPIAPPPVVDGASGDATPPITDSGAPDADADVEPGGALLWEVHGLVGPGTLDEAMALAPNRIGGVTFGFSFSGVVALGDQTLDGGTLPGVLDGPAYGAIAAISAANTIAWPHVLPARALESVSIDLAGDTYVGGQYATSEELLVPLADGGVVLPPVRGDASTEGTGFVAKLRGSDGQPTWLNTLDPGPDAGEASSLTHGVAVRIDALTVGASFTGRVNYPGVTDAAAVNVPSAGGQRDAVVLYLDRVGGAARWGRRLSGVGSQDVNVVALDKDQHVLGGGLTGGK